MNTHGTHTATCLCCVHFEYVAETGPYSDMTPGDNAYLSCRKGVFHDVFSPNENDYHKTCLIGESCTKFSPRPESGG